jgi:hypothetical protein
LNKKKQKLNFLCFCVPFLSIFAPQLCVKYLRERKYKMIKKRFFILMLVALLGGAIGGKCHAQIFIEDNEVVTMTNNNREMMNPFDNEKELNQLADRGTYAPIGSGILVMCGLGGAYLLSQRRKK